MSADIQINAGRLWGSLMEMAKIGATPKGGVKRLTLTELDGRGRDLFVSWCKAPASRIHRHFPQRYRNARMTYCLVSPVSGSAFRQHPDLPSETGCKYRTTRHLLLCASNQKAG